MSCAESTASSTGTMALNCWVVRGGRIRVGQRAEVVDLDADSASGRRMDHREALSVTVPTAQVQRKTVGRAGSPGDRRRPSQGG